MDQRNESMARKDDKSKSPHHSIMSFDEKAPAQVPGQDQAVFAGTEQGSKTFERKQRTGLSHGESASVPGQESNKDLNTSLFSEPKAKGDAADLLYGYDKHRFRKKDEVSIYSEQMDERFSMHPNNRKIIILLVIAVLLVPVVTILPINYFTETGMEKGLAGWIEALGMNIHAFGGWISGTSRGNGIGIIFWQTATLLFVGASLAINGAVFQGAMKNALASPSTLGVMSGGSLGTLIYTLLFGVPTAASLVTFVESSEVRATFDAMSPMELFLSVNGRALCSLAGCFIVVMLVLLIAHIAGHGKVSKPAMVIAGTVFSSVISSAATVIRAYITANGDEAQLQAIQYVVGGSVSNIMGPLDFALVAVPVAIGTFIVMRMRFRLNLLAFDEEEAKSMGLSVNRNRNAMIAICTIMTAVVVSFCGNVGFVGFLVPHLSRKLVGPDFKYLLPTSALVGSIYLLISNCVMNAGNFLSGSLGSFTSIIGVVFFLVMAVRERRNGTIDWV